MSMFDHSTYWLVVYATPTKYMKVQCDGWREASEAAKIAREEGIEGLGLFIIEVEHDTDVDKKIRVEIITRLCEVFGWDTVVQAIYSNHPIPSMN